jgi:hypothetical protein
MGNIQAHIANSSGWMDIEIMQCRSHVVVHGIDCKWVNRLISLVVFEHQVSKAHRIR